MPTGIGSLWLFAGVMVLGQFSPGPDMLLLTHTALRKGAREGLQTAAGIACGLTVHATIAVAGVAVAFQRLPLLRTALQWGAAAYLLWLAWGMAREFFVAWHSGAIYEMEVVESRRAPFVRGLLCNLLNPKAALFIAAVSAVQRQLEIPLATIKTSHRRQLKLPTGDNYKQGSLGGSPRSPGGREGRSPRRGFRGEANGVELPQLGGVWGGSPMIRAGIIRRSL